MDFSKSYEKLKTCQPALLRIKSQKKTGGPMALPQGFGYSIYATTAAITQNTSRLVTVSTEQTPEATV